MEHPNQVLHSMMTFSLRASQTVRLKLTYLLIMFSHVNFSLPFIIQILTCNGGVVSFRICALISTHYVWYRTLNIRFFYEMAGGRPSAFTKQKRDQIFNEHLSLFRENNKVPPQSNPIWAEIKKNHRLPQSVSPGAIYTCMLNKYRNLTEVENLASDNGKSNENKKSTENDSEKTKLNESSSSIESDENESDDEDISIQFSVKIPMKVWDTIKPSDTTYKRADEITRRTVTRNYKVLNSGVWTYCLSRAIAQQKKGLQCRMCFKRSKVFTSESAENYITVHGYCVTCNAKLVGFVKKMPDIEARFIEFKLKIDKIDSAKHHQQKVQKNVRISGKQAYSMYGSKESHGQAARIQRSILRESVGGELFVAPVERVPSKNAIRCYQSRNRRTERIDVCPVKALEILKLSYHDDWIQAIGSNPFYVTLVDTKSRILYNVYKKKNKSSTVYCDATGGIAHRLGMQSIFKLNLIIKY